MLLNIVAVATGDDVCLSETARPLDVEEGIAQPDDAPNRTLTLCNNNNPLSSDIDTHDIDASSQCKPAPHDSTDSATDDDGIADADGDALAPIDTDIDTHDIDASSQCKPAPHDSTDSATDDDGIAAQHGENVVPSIAHSNNVGKAVEVSLNEPNDDVDTASGVNTNCAEPGLAAGANHVVTVVGA